MPGRGQPWKKGGHIDDTIDSGDIVDGTIKEVDLDSALQAKVNSGGYDSISDEGGEILPQRAEINFTGAGVEATDSGGRTVVTVAGGGGSLDTEELSGLPLNNWYHDQFTYKTVADFQNEWTTGSGAPTIETNTQGEFGAVKLNTSGGSGGIGDATNEQITVKSSQDWEIIFRIQTVDQINSAKRIGLMLVGQGNPSGAFPYATEPSKYIWFHVNAQPFDSAWNVTTNDGSTINGPTDTTFGTQGNYVVLKIKHIANTSIEFLTGGGGEGGFTSRVTFTTNLPTGTFKPIISGQNDINDGSINVDTVFVNRAEL